MRKDKKELTYEEFLEKERVDCLRGSKVMLNVDAGGFLQEARKKSDPETLLYQIENSSLKTIHWQSSYEIPELEKGGDFVLDMFKNAERYATYFIRTRILDHQDFPHSLLQVVRTENWKKTIQEVETPKNYEDSAYHLYQMVENMKDKGLITVTIENFSIYRTTILRANTKKDEFLNKFADWVYWD